MVEIDDLIEMVQTTIGGVAENQKIYEHFDLLKRDWKGRVNHNTGLGIIQLVVRLECGTIWMSVKSGYFPRFGGCIFYLRNKYLIATITEHFEK